MGELAPPVGPPGAPSAGQPGVPAPPAAPAKKGTISLFGGGPKDTLVTPATPEINKELSGMSRRLRMLEERNENLRKKISLVESNMLDNNKKVMAEVKTSASDLIEIKSDIKDIEAKMMLLIKEINLLAKKEEVDIIKKYMEFWRPLNFVTPTQVEKIVKEMLEEHLEK